MARAKATDALRSKTKPNAVEELTRGIATLRELSVQIEDLTRDGFPYREAVRARTELSFRETIRRLFGEKSPEYQAHKNHKLRVGSRAESAQSTSLLKEFIAALEIQKAEVLGLKPEEVLAVVSAAPDRPPLVAVPPASSPDTATPPSALEPAPLAAATVSNPPAPSPIASAPVSPLPPSLPTAAVTSSVAVSSAPILATGTLPPSVRTTPEHQPIQPSLPVTSGSAEAAAAPQIGIAPPVGAGVPPETVPPARIKTAGDAPIPTTTNPPLAPTLSAVPHGTMPPVPQTTLRPRAALPVGTETQAATPPAHTQAQPPAQAAMSPRLATPSPAVATTGAAPAPAPDMRNVNPISQATAPVPTSTTPMPQQELTASQPVAQTPPLVRPAPSVSTENPIPPKVQESKGHLENGTLDILRRVCARFHLVARQLRLRKEYRPTLEINDEYDLQDLFYALLRLQFDEVGTEDWSPTYANGMRRTSYLLDWDKTAVVVKQTRSGLTTKDLAEQVAADKAHYAARPNGATLVCFIYDPEGRVGNPRGLEADLTSTEGPYRVEVIVAPK